MTDEQVTWTDPGYDQIDNLIDNDPIELGRRYRRVLAENERLRDALQEIAECPNEGPFLRRLARRALGGA